MELSHREVNTISPCNCDNSIVILGNIMSSFVIRTTGCAFSLQYVMKFPHQPLFLVASPNSLPPIQTLLQGAGSRAGIPLWMHTFLRNAELRNRATLMEICFYNSLYSSVRIYFFIINCYTYHGWISGTNRKLDCLLDQIDYCPSFIKRKPQRFLLNLWQNVVFSLLAFKERLSLFALLFHYLIFK